MIIEELSITRDLITTRATQGVFQWGYFRCVSLELPWLNNMDDISCIPVGRYRCSTYKSPRLGGELVLALHDVPDRDNIQIHPLNYPTDSRGCIGVGLVRGIDMIAHSRLPFDCIIALAKEAGRARREMWLTISEGSGCVAGSSLRA